MCLHTRNVRILKKAEYLYKVCFAKRRITNEIPCFISYFESCRIYLNKESSINEYIYNVILDRLKENPRRYIPQTIDENTTYFRAGKEGFHGFSSLKEALRFIQDQGIHRKTENLTIVKCKIPKGAVTFVGTFWHPKYLSQKRTAYYSKTGTTIIPVAFWSPEKETEEI